MMANQWFHKGRTATDAADELLIKGQIAGTVFHKGKVIWDKTNSFATGRNVTFWDWAAPSMLGGGAFRSEDYYNNVYLPSLPYGGGYVTDFVPTMLHIGPPGISASLHTAPSGTAGVDYEDFHPPYIENASGITVQDLGYDGEKVNYLITRNADIDMRFVYHALNTFTILGYDYIYQWIYPCLTVCGTISLPPGEYKLYLAWSHPYYISPRPYATYRQQEVQRVVCTINGEALESGGLTIAYGHTFPVTLTEADDVDVAVEIGVVTGEAGTSVNGSYGFKFTRSESYTWAVQRNQLRGRLNTKRDGTGREFYFVLNGIRIEGEFPINKKPTLCLDPETLEYVEIDEDRRVYTGDEHQRGGTIYKDYIQYSCSFYDDYVRVSKTLYTWAGGYSRAETILLARIDLYYVEGFSWYGGSSING